MRRRALWLFSTLILIHISTAELEAKLGIHDIRHCDHSRALRYLKLGHVFRMEADRSLSRTPSLLPVQRCSSWVVDGNLKQPSGTSKTKGLSQYDSALQEAARRAEAQPP